ncbi:hypothetical protein BDN71DRAFT_1435036 [Pleurotus eryngii]|uniref:Uncharacterized protein n=1 Tax=Pleurotus eryngii TaxID=5323 RepID=A0A9P5ZLX2_PLEER|nr:hypothetical protein BDN71DRAFT_1435036 [Pleurotus eryngii]
MLLQYILHFLAWRILILFSLVSPSARQTVSHVLKACAVGHLELEVVMMEAFYINNPIALLLGEAYHKFSMECLVNTHCLLTVTLGTGHGSNLHAPPSPVFVLLLTLQYYQNPADSLASIATDCENTQQKAWKAFPEDDTYWHFNCRIQHGSDWKKVLELDDWQ